MLIQITIPKTSEDYVFEEYLLCILRTLLNNVRYAIPSATLFSLNLEGAIRGNKKTRIKLRKIFNDHYENVLTNCLQEVLSTPQILAGVMSVSSEINIPGRILELTKEEVQTFLLNTSLKSLKKALDKETKRGVNVVAKEKA